MKFEITAMAVRRCNGQALMVPLVFLTLLVILATGFFAFEIARTAQARDQLRTATEAAALAGGAALAGSDSDSISDSQNNAINAARSVFVRNDIFGVALANPAQSNAPPVKEKSTLTFQFLDPNKNNAPVPQGDPRGKVLQVNSQYGLPSLVGSFIGLGGSIVGLQATASGGAGQLDLVLCFDCSGSMDDNTLMTHVRRRWDAVNNKVEYRVVRTGKLADYMGSIKPQQLSSDFNADLRGSSDNSAPGNLAPGSAKDEGFTDAVVNLDERDNFAGLSADGYSFPDVATLVEASRGNLENQAIFDSSKASTTITSIVPKAGYQAKYWQLARKHIHPFAEAEAASHDFYNLMNKNAKSHFGLVVFNGSVGETASTTFTEANISSSYAAGGNGNFGLPGISLSKDEGKTNFDEVNAGLTTTVPYGATNIGGSVERAVRMFDTGSRPNAKKAIIVFTDGIPTVGGPLSGAPAENCRLAAARAKSKGIAVYTVGLALEPSLFAAQRQLLGDDTPGGMAAIAGNGSKFFQVTNTANLKAAFANVARHLTQLVQ